MNVSGTVVVLTPMNLEYKAMRAQLAQFQRIRHPEGTIFEVGKLPGTPWRVALMVTGEGNNTAAVLAERAISWFQPEALLVVGVAGGLKDDIQLGDVVVATWVHGYHGGKEDAEGFRARPRSWAGTHLLEQAARHVEADARWTQRLPVPARPTVHFKPIAAGEVVLNSQDTPLARQLRRNYDDAAAIEMESAGAGTAAHLNASIPMLAIRGISDKADGEKHLSDAAGLQPVAASHAAAFAAALLAELATTQPASGGRPAPARGAAAASLDAQAYPDPAIPGPGAAWRPLPEALPVTWLPGLIPGRATGPAALEAHLIPVGHHAPPQARRLAELKAELATLGRAEGLFDPAESLQSSDPATVFSPAGKGIAVTCGGQRTAWQPLPADTIGAVLDPSDTAERLADLLGILLQIDTSQSQQVTMAAGVTHSVLMSEGRVADLPRTAARQRTTMSPLRVPAAHSLSLDYLTANLPDAAAELAARLAAVLRAKTAW